jgi:hypothetical protein
MLVRRGGGGRGEELSFNFIFFQECLPRIIPFPLPAGPMTANKQSAGFGMKLAVYRQSWLYNVGLKL